jgi:hypothetical protein
MTIVPNFTTGEVVSATKLNQLADAAYKASSILQSPNVGFPWVESTISGTRTYSLRHYSANLYLHAYVQFVGGDADDIDIWIDGTAMSLGAGNLTEGTHKWILTIPGSVATGEIYQVVVTWANGSGQARTDIQFVGESSKTTALY